MNVKDIIIASLKAMGADGLCNRDMECGCGLEDFFLCDWPNPDCEPAKKKIAAAEDVSEDSEFKVGDEIYIAMKSKP